MLSTFIHSSDSWSVPTVASLLIKGGLLVSGSGNPPFRGRVLAEGDRVAFVGRREGYRSLDAGRVIDAEGLYVAPGFIDVRSHFDETALLYPDAGSALLQGITTAIGGNCGFSPAPLREWWLWSFWRSLPEPLPLQVPPRLGDRTPK